MVDGKNGKLEPFTRDKLFIAIYESCRHRTTATSDAAGLTETVISQILARPHEGMLQRKDIVQFTHQALERFDKAAATIYLAYHPI